MKDIYSREYAKSVTRISIRLNGRMEDARERGYGQGFPDGYMKALEVTKAKEMREALDAFRDCGITTDSSKRVVMRMSQDQFQAICDLLNQTEQE